MPRRRARQPAVPGHWQGGQNARLAAKLTGWKIDIKSETQFAEQLREQGLTMEEAMGGEAPAAQDADMADDYYPQQDQDDSFDQ